MQNIDKIDLPGTTTKDAHYNSKSSQPIHENIVSSHFIAQTCSIKKAWQDLIAYKPKRLHLIILEAYKWCIKNMKGLMKIIIKVRMHVIVYIFLTIFTVSKCKKSPQYPNLFTSIIVITIHSTILKINGVSDD